MATVFVPAPDEIPNLHLQTSLDGIPYGLDFLWNERDQSWYFDIADDTGDCIAGGIRIVSGKDLLAEVADSRKPPGVLFVYDAQGVNTPSPETTCDPNFTSLGLGRRHQLAYTEAEDLGRTLL